MDSDHFSFFFDVIIAGPGVVTHRRSFYARVLFKINAQRGTTERDDDDDVLVRFLLRI